MSGLDWWSYRVNYIGLKPVCSDKDGPLYSTVGGVYCTGAAGRDDRPYNSGSDDESLSVDNSSRTIRCAWVAVETTKPLSVY